MSFVTNTDVHPEAVHASESKLLLGVCWIRMVRLFGNNETGD